MGDIIWLIGLATIGHRGLSVGEIVVVVEGAGIEKGGDGGLVIGVGSGLGGQGGGAARMMPL